MLNNKKIDFIGIGAPKCGSTWVAKCLEEHPNINFSPMKEVHFFNRNILDNGPICVVEDKYDEKGLEWYFRQFPSKKLGKITGEFSISYLYDEQALKRIKKHFPNVKILVTLRNPIDLIYSLYWFIRADIHVKKEKFESYIKNDDVLKQGLYYHHLRKAYTLFPPENIHIILLDDIRRNPIKLCKELYQFLDVSEAFNPSILNKKVNPSRVIRSEDFKTLIDRIFKVLIRSKILPYSLYKYLRFNPKFYNLYLKMNTKIAKYPPMSIKDGEYLKNYYREDIKNLETLIVRKMNDWHD